jgi:prolipoprotein diacylglyceryltransferase
MVAMGVSHLLSGDAFGSPADLPWSIYLWNEYRHPSQVYEILTAVVILIIVIKRPLGQAGEGVSFLVWVALSSAARIFLEAFRGDSVTWPGGFRAAQVVGLGILAITLYVMQIWARTQETEVKHPEISEKSLL